MKSSFVSQQKSCRQIKLKKIEELRVDKDISSGTCSSKVRKTRMNPTRIAELYIRQQIDQPGLKKVFINELIREWLEIYLICLKSLTLIYKEMFILILLLLF